MLTVPPVCLTSNISISLNTVYTPLWFTPQQFLRNRLQHHCLCTLSISPALPLVIKPSRASQGHVRDDFSFYIPCSMVVFCTYGNFPSENSLSLSEDSEVYTKRHPLATLNVFFHISQKIKNPKKAQPCFLSHSCMPLDNYTTALRVAPQRATNQWWNLLLPLLYMSWMKFLY